MKLITCWGFEVSLSHPNSVYICEELGRRTVRKLKLFLRGEIWIAALLRGEALE